MNSQYLTLKEAARFLGVNEKTLKNLLIKNKELLVYKKLARRYVIDKDALSKLIANNDFVY